MLEWFLKSRPGKEIGLEVCKLPWKGFYARATVDCFLDQDFDPQPKVTYSSFKELKEYSVQFEQSSRIYALNLFPNTDGTIDLIVYRYDPVPF